MALKNGQVIPGGVVIGRHKRGSRFDPNDRSALEDVARQLQAQFQLRVGLYSWLINDALKDGMQSHILQAANVGAIFRVLSGNGMLMVLDTTYAVKLGDWGYIPAHEKFSFVGAARQSPLFRVTYGQLFSPKPLPR